MKIVTFRLGAGNYRCEEPGVWDGEYVRLEEVAKRLREMELELAELKDAVRTAQSNILFMPTWVNENSYNAQVDMRARCYVEAMRILNKKRDE